MKQFFPTVYHVCKVLFLLSLSVYLLSFLAVREGYLGTLPAMIFDRLHIVVLFLLGIFGLLSFFQHFASVTVHPLLIRVAFLFLGLVWSAGVLYLYFFLSYA